MNPDRDPVLYVRGSEGWREGLSGPVSVSLCRPSGSSGHKVKFPLSGFSG